MLARLRRAEPLPTGRAGRLPPGFDRAIALASSALTGALPWNATAISADVAAEITRLKQEPGGDIEVYGSATLVQTLMRQDLVDEFRIAVHPLVLGDGTRMVPQGGVSATLRLTDTRTLDSGVVSLTYARP